MDKIAMLEVADMIEKARPESFSMGSFFGNRVTVEELDSEYEEDIDSLQENGYELTDFVNRTDQGFQLEDLNKIIEDNTIKISCNSTACIAGWVVINQWLKSDNSMIDKEYIESQGVTSVITMACNILDISYSEAAKLFYCDTNSVWQVLANEYGFYFNTEIPETWNLDNKKVADVLRRIVNGEIELTDEWLEDNDPHN